MDLYVHFHRRRNSTLITLPLTVTKKIFCLCGIRGRLRLVLSLDDEGTEDDDDPDEAGTDAL